MNDVSEMRTPRPWLRFVGTALACIAILAGSAAAIVVINRTEPTAQQINATRKSAALVETITVTRGDFSPQIAVLGTVEPAQEIILSPRVGGQVTELSPDFRPGGMVRADQLLLRIDPADFQNRLSISQSELAQTQASLEIEEGRQILAKKELQLLEGTIDETDRALVLRVPQLASIKASVSAAEAAVERANLELERTRVVAPFDAQIIRRSVNLGSQVSPGDELAQLVGIKEYWVQAAVPIRSLRWIQFQDSDEVASQVTLMDPDVWGAEVERKACVTTMIGTLDQQTRLARVLITVTDPLGVESGEPPLILDTLIDVKISGRVIEDVVRVPREFVRDSDTVWVLQDNALAIREVQVVFRDAEYAYIRDGLVGGDEVVTTTLATVAEGVGLRKIDSPKKPMEVEKSDETETKADPVIESATGSKTDDQESAK